MTGIDRLACAAIYVLMLDDIILYMALFLYNLSNTHIHQNTTPDKKYCVFFDVFSSH